jgi:hypothetical protein
MRWRARAVRLLISVLPAPAWKSALTRRKGFSIDDFRLDTLSIERLALSEWCGNWLQLSSPGIEDQKTMPSLAEKIFIADGRLRPAWRFALSIPGVFVAFLAAQLGLEMVPQGVKSRFASFQIFFFNHLLLLLALLGVFKILTAFCDRTPLGSVGLAFHSRWGRELGVGTILGAVMILTVAALEGILRQAHFGVNSLSPAQVLSTGGFYGVTFGLAATNEELVFRGYPFQRLVEAITAAGGIFLTSALFGLAHLGNAHHTWVSTANTALVGVPLAIAYLRTRSLWMPVGIHFSWNFVLGFVIGLPISGYALPESLLKAQVHGAAWLTGAEYGPEGGVLATIAILGATIYLLLSKRICVSEEMRELTVGPSITAQFPTISEAAAPSTCPGEVGGGGSAPQGGDRRG